MLKKPATMCHGTLGAKRNRRASAEGIQGRKEFGTPYVIPSVVLSGSNSFIGFFSLCFILHTALFSWFIGNKA